MNNFNSNTSSKKIVKKAPQKETIDIYNEIKQFIKKQQTQDEKRINTQLRDKVKMPFKMYKGIKIAVKKKYEKEKLINADHGIIGQTGMKEKKLMTKFVENRLEKEEDEKNNMKLKFSHGKKKSKFKDGVMNVNKGFIRNLKRNNNENSGNRGYNNKRKFNKPKGGKRQ